MSRSCGFVQEADMTKAAVALLGLLALSAGIASAQETAPRDTVPRSMLDRAARSNWYLRTVTLDAPHDTIAGRVRRAGDRYRIGDALLEPAMIRSLDRRMEEGGGALVGALVGAIVMGALAEGVSHLGGRDDGSTDWIALGLGAGGGAMFGMLAGHAAYPGRVYWQTIWPDP
jgi:hypothetical protein